MFKYDVIKLHKAAAAAAKKRKRKKRAVEWQLAMVPRRAAAQAW